MKLLTIFFFLLGVTFLVLIDSNFDQDRDILGGDQLGYYSYLPSCFIYENLKRMDSAGNDKVVPDRLINYIQLPPYNNPKTPKGIHITQYTYGVALAELPGFVCSHLIAKWSGKDSDGFSPIYQLGIKVFNVLYILFGFLFIYLSLRRFSSKTIAMLTISLLWVGTNLLYFTTIQPGMSHIPIFFLTSILVYLTPIYYETKKSKYLLIISFILGWITIIRTTDIVIGLFFLLYRVYSLEKLKQRFLDFYLDKKTLFLAFVFFTLPILPQLIYWKYTTGQFFYYSYGTQKLDLLHPHIKEGLIGGGNGWLHYSPFMILSLVGFYFLKKEKSYAAPIVLIFFLYIYVIYSWFCYQYINGFGSRPMIDIYPILAIPLALFLDKMSEWKKSIRLIIWGFVFFSIYVNMAFSFKNIKGQLWSEASRFTFNASTLFKYTISKNDIVTMDIPYLQPSHPEEYSHVSLAKTNFESDTNSQYDSLRNSRIYSFSNSEFSPVLAKYRVNISDFSQAKYLKIGGKFKTHTSTYYYYSYSKLMIRIRRNGEEIINLACNIDNKLRIDSFLTSKRWVSGEVFRVNTGVWDEMNFYLPYPLYKDIKDGDEIEVLLWSPAKQSLSCDEIEIGLMK